MCNINVILLSFFNSGRCTHDANRYSLWQVKIATRAFDRDITVTPSAKGRYGFSEPTQIYASGARTDGEGVYGGRGDRLCCLCSDYRLGCILSFYVACGDRWTLVEALGILPVDFARGVPHDLA